MNRPASFLPSTLPLSRAASLRAGSPPPSVLLMTVVAPGVVNQAAVVSDVVVDTRVYSVCS